MGKNKSEKRPKIEEVVILPTRDNALMKATSFVAPGSAKLSGTKKAN